MASMGQYAALLQIGIRADTHMASQNLTRLQSTLTRTGTSARTATTHTDRFQRSSSRLGSTLGTVGKAAVGAAAAYIGISQAKQAIEVTTELAKSTKLLQNNLKMSAENASSFAAVAKTRGVDTRGLAMATKTLATQTDQANKGAESSVEAFNALGISQKELKNLHGEKLLLAIAQGAKEAGKSVGTTAALGKLLGRSFAPLGALFRDGAKGMKEQQQTAKDLGASFSEVGAKDMNDFIQKLRESKLAVMGLQIQFTQALQPVLMKAMGWFTDLAKNIRKEGFAKAMGDAITQMANRAGALAPKVAGAFIQGFMAADAWGKLALGGFLLAKMGALKSVGAALGKALLTGVAQTKIGAAIISYFPSLGQWTAQGQASGTSYGKGFIIGLALAIPALIGATLGEALAKGAPKWDVFSKGWIQRQFSLAWEAVKGIGNIMGKLGGDVWNKLKGPFDKVGGIFGHLKNVAIGSFNTMKGPVVNVIHTITNALKGIVRAVATVIRKFQNLTDTLSPSSGGGSGGTDIFGIHIPNLSPLNPIPTGQTGLVVPGTGIGDKVAALLEPGEVVVNRRAVQKMGGPNRVDAINEIIPRFAGGGVVGRGLTAEGQLGIDLAAIAGAKLIKALKRTSGTAGLGSVITNANRMNALHQPYVWGGGHGATASRNGPWDCSGAISELLAGSVVPGFAPVVSGGFMSMFKAGEGPLSIFASPSHVWAKIGGKAFGTSQSNPGGGAGWIAGSPSTGGYAVRHVPLAGGLGRKSGKKGKGDAAKKGFMWGGIIQRLAGGGVVKGKTSVFGPPLEAAGTTASGVSSSRAGIAIYDRSTLGKMFDVTVAGHTARLRQTDIGPAPWTGRKIDITGAGVRALGMNPRNFPTDALGTARLVSSQSKHKGTTGKTTAKKKGKDAGQEPLEVPQEIQDIMQAYYDNLQTAVDTENERRSTLNDLLGESNLSALQGYQVAASQNRLVGLGMPNVPALSTFYGMLANAPEAPDLSNLSSLADINTAAVNAFLVSQGQAPTGIYGNTGRAPRRRHTAPAIHNHFYVDGKEIQGITQVAMRKASRRGRRRLPSAGA